MSDLALRIDNYLLGRLPAADRQSFETTLADDPALAGEVELARTVLIDDYAAGLLEADRRQAFEKRLGEDSLLRAELTLQQAAVAGLKHDPERLAFQNGLRKMMAESDAQPEQTLRPSYVRRWALAAAAALAMCFVAWFFFLRPAAPDYQAYDQKMLAGLTTMGSDALDSLSRFKQLFEEKKYAEARPYLQNARGDQYRLREGLCDLRMEPPQLARAQQIFEQIDADGTSDFRHEATWYLAQTYAAQQNWAACAAAAARIPENRYEDFQWVPELMEEAKKKAAKR